MTTTVTNTESKPKTRDGTAGDHGQAHDSPMASVQPFRHKREWKWPAMILFAAAVVVAIIALWPAPAATVQEQAGPPPVNVRVLELQAVAQRDEMRLPAVLEPFRTVHVAAEVDGRVEKLGPKEGTDVKPGDSLAWLNTELLQAAYDQAKANHVQATAELTRYEGLEKRGVATDIEMVRARAAEAVAKAMLTQAAERLERAVITAPIDGVLNDLIVEPGEFVGAGKPVAQIVEVDTLKAIVNVPERDVVHVKVGQPVRVVVDALEDFELKGKVRYIDQCGDQLCRTFRTEVTVDNRDRRARAGLIVRVIILRRVIEEAIMIPLVSVIPTETGYQVFVEEDGKASRRDVEIGLIVKDKVQAKTGLKPGDRLIIDGHRMVGHGSLVTVLE